MWAQKFSNYYQLFIAVAILRQFKTEILELNSFDDTLKVTYNYYIILYIENME